MNSNENPEIASIRRMLRELSDLAEHASLTGSLGSGVARAVQRYNAMLERLTHLEAVPTGLFTSLDQGAGYGGLGVECRMLMAHLTPTKEDRQESSSVEIGDPSVLVRLAPFVDSEDLGKLVREHLRRNTRIDMDLLSSIAPFLDSDIMGEIIREQLRASTPPAPPAPPTPPAPPGPTMVYVAPSASNPAPQAVTTDLTPASVAEPGESLESLTARLRDPGLTPDERQSIAMRLAQIAHEEATRDYYTPVTPQLPG
jgi:hypothetical protein